MILADSGQLVREGKRRQHARIFIVCEKFCGSQATKARSKREYEDLSTGAAEEDVETTFNQNQDKVGDLFVI